MQFNEPFTTFNPLTGYFNDLNSLIWNGEVVNNDTNTISYPIILDWMAKRSRKLLLHRSSEDITNALNVINYIFDRAITAPVDATTNNDSQTTTNTTNTDNSDDEIEIDLATDASASFQIDKVFEELQLPGAKSKRPFTPARLLRSQIASIDIDQLEQFADAQWEEYFAVLTLALLGNIHLFCTLDGRITASTSAHIATSMEALTFAENPSLFSADLNLWDRNKASLRGLKFAIAQHAKLAPWKKQCCEWVRTKYIPRLKSRTFKKSEASRAFFIAVIKPILNTEQGAVFEGKNIDRILRDALAKEFPGRK